MEEARKVFEAELTARRVAFTWQESDDRYLVHTSEGDRSVGLDNIARVYAQEREPDVIVGFVDQVLSCFELPPWPEARPLVYFAAESSEYAFGDTLRQPVTDEVARVLVLTDREERNITWLTHRDLAAWGVTQAEAESAAGENLARLLAGLRLKVELIDGMRLAMVPLDSVFKASVIFSPNFKAFITQELDWPVLAVIPCRDFIYAISERDRALLQRMGGVVQREFRESGYPVTTEVLRISDAGIEAIGAFPK